MADTLRWHTEKMAHVVLAIEDLIDEKLHQRAGKRPVFLDAPGALRWSRDEGGALPECWVTWGRVQVKVGSVERAGSFFIGHFELSPDPIPGQHSLQVAQQRVEDRYREWYEQASASEA